jgi:hypothetical protein
MTPYQQAQALIAAAEQTYFENYYGDNLIPLFGRNKVALGTDANAQHDESVEGESV